LHKRVLYSHGLVLGVGELKTEQNFMLGHHYGHNRRLHGYGTGAGLKLEIRDPGDGPECVVYPGWGVDVQGHDICVHDAQCAKLNQWLLQQQQAGDLSSPLDTSGTSSIEAYVVLCYHECETDKVPVPVGPCLSLDKAMVPSRIEESFELQLLADPPAQVEEEAIRRLGDILSRVSVATGAGGLTTADALVAEIRALVNVDTSPGSIPSIPADLVLDPAYADEIVRAGLRVFVTEVRPALVPDGGPCLNGPPDACLLLGKLTFDVAPGPSGPEVVTNSVVIDERRRPLLLTTRLLEEALLADMLPGFLDSTNEPLISVSSGTNAAAVATPMMLMAHARAASTGGGTTTLISLLPSAASPAGSAAAAVFEGVPSIRFRRNGSVVFPFSVPPGLSTAAPLTLRLHWAFSRPDGSDQIDVSWDASLRLESSNADLSTFTNPEPQASIPGPAPAAANNRLLTTGFFDLPRGAAANPVLGFLNLTARTTVALPQTYEIHLIFAELSLATGGAV